MSSKRLYYDSIVKWKVTGTQKGMETEWQTMNLIIEKQILIIEEVNTRSRFLAK